MSATDELRRLLDGRGVEWMPSAWSARDETFYKVGNTGFLATEMNGGSMKVCIEGYVVPEQAVEATLGSEAEVENTWLKETYGYLIGMFEAEVAENAKLRELCADMWNELDAATQYDAGGGRGIVYEFADRMRELGVDV